MKINLPAWVYDNLDVYGNCALPNKCLTMNKEELIANLENATGTKITLRRCEFKHCEDNTITKEKRKTFYLVAETDR